MKNRIFIFFLIFSSHSIYSASFSTSNCEALISKLNLNDIENTRLYSEIKQLLKDNDESLIPTHYDLREDQARESLWDLDRKNAPYILQKLLPNDVYYIGHRLEYSPHPAYVRLDREGEGGMPVIARAHYKYKGIPLATNVVFSKAALSDNLTNLKDGWLIGPDAQAALFVFHGGAMKSTGSSTATTNLTYFSSFGIDVLAPDLHMHAYGPRKVLGGIEQDILAFGEFARKYIPPHVPLFVYGHSWGAVYADQLRSMKIASKDKSFFHPSLKGVIIVSPVADFAPEGSPREKVEGFIRHMRQAQKLAETHAPEHEKKIWPTAIYNGKLSLLGEAYVSATINQTDRTASSQSENDLPALMIAGKGDFVYFGAEDFFHNYYDKLDNVTAFYPDKLPYVLSKEHELRPVGHGISHYYYSDTIQVPYDVAMTTQFIAEQLNTTPDELSQHSRKEIPASNIPWVSASQFYSNNLAFRDWLNHFNMSSLENSKHEITTMMENQSKLFRDARKAVRKNLPINKAFYQLKQLSLISENSNSSWISRFVKPPFKDHIRDLLALSDQLPPHIQRLLVEFQTAKNQKEAQMIAREILKKEFLRLQLPLTVKKIVKHIQEEQPSHSPQSLDQFQKEKRLELSVLLDQFPYDTQIFQENFIFLLPPLMKEKILEWYDLYTSTLSKQEHSQILRAITRILTTYHPQNILYTVLESLSEKPMPKNMKRYYSQRLQKLKAELAKFPSYQQLVSELDQLLETKSNDQMIHHALSIVENQPALPVDKQTYSIKKLSGLNITEDQLVESLKEFHLTDEIQDQIIELFKEKSEDLDFSIHVSIVNLIISNTPINLHYSLIQLLQELVYKHTLNNTITYFEHINSSINQDHIRALQKLISTTSQSRRMTQAYQLILDYYYSDSKLQDSKFTISLHNAFYKNKSIKPFLQKAPLDEETKKLVQDLYNQYQKNRQFIDRRALPSLENFYAYTKAKKTEEMDHHYLQEIEKLKHNIQKIRELEAEEKRLRNEKEEIVSKEIHSLTNNVNHAIHLIQDTYTTALTHPPTSLKEEYQELQEELNQLIATSQTLIDALYRTVLPFLEGQLDFNSENFNAQLTLPDIQNKKQDFDEQFNRWTAFHQKLKRKVATAAINGEIGKELQIAFVNIYGPSVEKAPQIDLSIHTKLQTILLEIAKKESKLLSINEELLQLVLEYNQIYPAPAITVARPIEPMQILNPDFEDIDSHHALLQLKEHIERNQQFIEEVINIWNNMRSTLPPELPE